MEKQARIKAILQARKLHKTHHLLALDLVNAFNMLRFEPIISMFRRTGVPLNYEEYIMAFLQMRFDPRVRQCDRGVAQGDVLSSYIFAATIDPIIMTLANKYIIIAYLDDILLALRDD